MIISVLLISIQKIKVKLFSLTKDPKFWVCMYFVYFLWLFSYILKAEVFFIGIYITSFINDQNCDFFMLFATKLFKFLLAY